MPCHLCGCGPCHCALSATPAIEPTGAADVLAAPHPLEVRRDALVARLLAAGFVEQERMGDTRRFTGGGWSIPVPGNSPATSVRDFGEMVGEAERFLRRQEADKARPAPHDAARDWADLCGPTPAEVQSELMECTRLSECRRKEVIRRGDAIARLEKAISAAEADRDYERQRANEAIAQLYDAREAAKQVRAAIFAALGVEPDDTSTLRLLVTVRHHIQTLRGDFRRVEEESREAVHLLQLLGVPVGTLPDMIAALLPKSRLMKLRIRNETEAALAIDNLSLQEVAEDDPRMVEAIRLHQQATALRRAAEPVRDHLPDAGKMVNA